MMTSLAQQLLDTALEMNTTGLNQGTSGNVSVRLDNAGYIITPSGVRYDECDVEDMVSMSDDGQYHSVMKPSSEWRFHQDVYKSRADVGAIVHVHSTFATTIACMGKEIPAFHYMVAAAGGKNIRCANYHTFGTQALSDSVVEAMQERHACLMENHGMLATGPTLKKALAMAVEVEKLCEIYWRLLPLGGGNHVSDVEMEVIIEKFKTYGQFSKAQ